MTDATTHIIYDHSDYALCGVGFLSADWIPFDEYAEGDTGAEYCAKCVERYAIETNPMVAFIAAAKMALDGGASYLDLHRAVDYAMVAHYSPKATRQTAAQIAGLMTAENQSDIKPLLDAQAI